MIIRAFLLSLMKTDSFLIISIDTIIQSTAKFNFCIKLSWIHCIPIHFPNLNFCFVFPVASELSWLYRLSQHKIVTSSNVFNFNLERRITNSKDKIMKRITSFAVHTHKNIYKTWLKYRWLRIIKDLSHDVIDFTFDLFVSLRFFFT